MIETRTTINVLMVEDSPTDVFLTREILSESRRNLYKIYAVKDGIEAMAFLRRIDSDKQSYQPDLILLDLNLPRMNGFDFLARIKAVPELKTIPVCILTTSESDSDIEEAKELKADCYLIKPLDLDKFESTFFGFNAS